MNYLVNYNTDKCIDNLLYFILYNIIYVTYIETRIGGILFRPDQDNVYRPNFCSLVNFLIQPLNIKRAEVFDMFWKPKNWDMNYLVVTCGAWSIKGIYNYTINLF
jgi:hypothetical protein